ncbi:MAG: hypothetical protein ACHQ01_09615 [Candidatus Limnocylindrales bacterium]
MPVPGNKEDHNDTEERMQHGTRPDMQSRIPSKHVLGTPEELQARVGGTFATLPDNAPTVFKQIDGSKSRGGNTNDERPPTHSAAQKFGDWAHYTGGRGGKG